MTDVQIAGTITLGIFSFMYIVNNLLSFARVDYYKKTYSEIERGVYKYSPQFDSSFTYFYLYHYNIRTTEFTKTNVNIIFFVDSIKLSENIYIHKNQLWVSMIDWYFYKKFNKLKVKLIEEYNFSQEYARMRSDDGKRFYFVKKPTFKFFRG